MLQELYDYILTVLNENMLAQGGIVIGGLTSLLYSIKSIFYFVKDRVIRKFKYAVYFDETNDMYEAFTTWYHKHHRQKFRDVEVGISRKYDDYTGVTKSSLKFSQYIDLNWIWYERRIIFISKDRDKLENANHYESLFLNKYRAWGLFADKALGKLCDAVYAEHLANQKLEKSIKLLYNFDNYGFAEKPIGKVKSFQQLFFDKKAALMDDLDNFIKSQKSYADKGIKYKRGYFFKGPPGTGKTSIALAMADYLKRNIYSFNLQKNDTDHKIIQFFAAVKPNSIVLMEDADKYLGEGDIKVNLSTILNCLDGCFAPDNIIVIMTTNYPDKIDPAILRDGRFDFKATIDLPSVHCINQFLSFVYEQPIKLSITKNRLAMSAIQNITLNRTAEEAVRMIEEGNLLKVAA